MTYRANSTLISGALVTVLTALPVWASAGNVRTREVTKCEALMMPAVSSANTALVPYSDRAHVIDPAVKDPYKVLGVRNDASLEEVRLAYRSLIGRFHSDRTHSAAEREMFARESTRLGEAFAALKAKLKDDNFFIQEQDFFKATDLVRRMSSKTASNEDADLVRESIFHIEHVARLAINRPLYEKSKKFREQFNQIVAEDIRRATPKEFDAICNQVEKEIKGEKSSIILAAFFASPRSVERPDLLKKLVNENRDDFSRVDTEIGPRAALYTALVQPHWAESRDARRIVIDLLNKMHAYHQSPMHGTGSVLDLIGVHLFSLPEWHRSLELDKDLREAYFANVLRYMKTVNAGSSEFVHFWFSSPDVLKYPERIEEISRSYPDIVFFNMIRFPHLRDSDLFWVYFEKAMPYSNRRLFLGALADATQGLAGTRRGDEVLERYFAMLTKDGQRSKNAAEIIELAKTLSHPTWVNKPRAAELMRDLLNGLGPYGGISGLVELISQRTSLWPSESVHLISTWAGAPSGPEFLAKVLSEYSPVYQRVGHRRTQGGGNIDLAMTEVMESPRRGTWLSNPRIGDLVESLLRNRPDSTYYVEKLLKAPELQSNPRYPIWAHAVSIKDRYEREKYLAETEVR